MMVKKGNVITAIALVLSAGALGVGSASVASAAPAASTCKAGHFCAYTDANYGGKVLLDVTGVTAGSNHINVASNKVSSVKNNTKQCWLGRDDRSWPLPDHTVLTAAPGSQIPKLSDGPNDSTDWFDVRDSGCKE